MQEERDTGRNKAGKQKALDLQGDKWTLDLGLPTLPDIAKSSPACKLKTVLKNWFLISLDKRDY